jgi:diaminopimelate epimerase
LLNLLENQVVKFCGLRELGPAEFARPEEKSQAQDDSREIVFQNDATQIERESSCGNQGAAIFNRRLLIRRFQTPLLVGFGERMWYKLPMLRFTKMNGAGNDFVMIDNRAGNLQLEPGQISKICDRHRGVGADGVLVLERPTNGANFRMRYYNADGGEAEMCGNGARCFARYASQVAGPLEKLSFETPAGVIGADLLGELVCLQMSEPNGLKLGMKIPLGSQTLDGHFVNSGVPHVVIPVEDLEKTDVRGIGSTVRHHELFAPKGANVNFLKRRGDRQISIRTYERGVENETLACGTGVVASALIFAATEGVEGPIGVLVRGGNELKVGFSKAGDQFKNVTLTGPADFVFEGTIEL